MDKKRQKAAKKLLDAAHDFFRACHDEGQYGAVQWLTGTGGELIIFTRGEYREHLLDRIPSLPNAGKIHVFGEEQKGGA